MENNVRTILIGIAVGVFAATVAEANILAVKTLWYFNRLAAETAREMGKGGVREIQRISDEVENES